MRIYLTIILLTILLKSNLIGQEGSKIDLNNVNVETLLIKNCDHHIPIEASSTALNFILKKI